MIGRALTALPDARADLWDSRNEVTVKLANADMWLESRTPSAVLGGANWAMLGSEMIAFQHAAMIAPETYRLSGLLRGMRGSEDAMRTHAEDEPFILLDPQALTALELPLVRMDSVVAIRARGPGDGDAPPIQNLTVTGLALRPLSPVHLRARRLADDSIHLLWTRRSRNGFAWIDRSDAPLAEEREHYELRISAAGNMLVLEASTSETVIGMIEQIALAGGRLTDFTVEIVQLSADIGSGRPAMRHLFLP